MTPQRQKESLQKRPLTFEDTEWFILAYIYLNTYILVVALSAICH